MLKWCMRWVLRALQENKTEFSVGALDIQLCFLWLLKGKGFPKHFDLIFLKFPDMNSIKLEVILILGIVAVNLRLCVT